MSKDIKELTPRHRSIMPQEDVEMANLLGIDKMVYFSHKLQDIKKYPEKWITNRKRGEK